MPSTQSFYTLLRYLQKLDFTKQAASLKRHQLDSSFTTIKKHAKNLPFALAIFHADHQLLHANPLFNQLYQPPATADCCSLICQYTRFGECLTDECLTHQYISISDAYLKDKFRNTQESLIRLPIQDQGMIFIHRQNL